MNTVTIEYTTRDEFDVDIEELGDIVIDNYIAKCGVANSDDIDNIIDYFGENIGSLIADLGLSNISDEDLDNAYYEILPLLKDYIIEELEED